MNKPLRSLGVPPNAWRVDGETADITRAAITPRCAMRSANSARRAHRSPVTLATETKTVRLDLAKAAILVIDMQNDFCHPDGWLAHIGVDVNPARKPIDPLNQLLPALRAADVPVIWVNWGNRPDLLNISAGLRHVYNSTGEAVGLGDPLPKNNAPVLTVGSWAAAVVDELQQLPEDLKVDKYRMSGFWDTG